MPCPTSATGIHEYWVPGAGESPTQIHAVYDRSKSGWYLRTDRDDTTKNDLDELPDCWGQYRD